MDTLAWAEAFRAMEALETGAVANPDEQRQVGHYWLRAPELAPSPRVAGTIRETSSSASHAFAVEVHASG